MRESLPPQLLAEKMPRFLQKCAQTFESDRRYCNDLRFIRIWLELVEIPDDILNASRLIFPGVGAFAPAMDVLNEKGELRLQRIEIQLRADWIVRSAIMEMKNKLNPQIEEQDGL